MKRIVILVSGYGSNLQAILDSCKKREISGKIVSVVSNDCQAFAIERARLANITTYLVASKLNKKDFFNQKLLKIVDSCDPDLVVLAGYMKILDIEFVLSYFGRILNIHPSLLPKYPGLYTHRQVLKYRDTQHGASVHFVTEKVDAGPLILQAKIPVSCNDTEYTLSVKVKEQEHKIYPLVVKWFSEGRLEMRGNNQVWLDGCKLPPSGMCI
ncbi:phosphoribosylglycinamide formyltransferase [Candidatus Erwinia haradaeae]|uniref:Phosphoribosylglycinamide formyltransferase n=1 Tax=Candidatus Erwinia haradaeae TaxID=1922217 RepID=A0A451D1I7_9GAMM|nr:phosphoribosylglycinamide formyltransferase [Candidatus Erwinia haradaeae]VFP79469.1 Phosphoribosylglycinamide formyltransferase [Candidatus Erwinia haradaeae]